MIIQQAIELNGIDKQGKGYAFKRPEACPRCGSNKIWGHGYVERYFDGYKKCLQLKRWICADCGCVIGIRPCGYFARHHISILTIYEHIKKRIETGKWIRGPDLSRQRQGHWLRALRKNINIFLGFEWSGKLLNGFQQLITSCRNPIIRLTQCEVSL